MRPADVIVALLILLSGCSSEPRPIPVPAGEAVYCEQNPEAPLCEPFSAK